MATYILLASFTEKGITAVRDTVKRADAVRKMGKKAGVTMKDTYWTLGAHDVVSVFEAPDDETMTAFMLRAAQEGFVRTQTLRAFPEAEMKKILDKMA
jgi:uncharacterized protein with GYD domain